MLYDNDIPMKLQFLLTVQYVQFLRIRQNTILCQMVTNWQYEWTNDEGVGPNRSQWNLHNNDADVLRKLLRCKAILLTFSSIDAFYHDHASLFILSDTAWLFEK